MDELLTTKQAAELLGKDHRTVRGYVARGVLPIARRVTDRTFLVSRADVEWIKAHPPKSGPVPGGKPNAKDAP